MNDQPIRNADKPSRSDAPRLPDPRPSRLFRWATPATLLLSWCSARAAESAYAAARSRGASRDVAANAAFRSMFGGDQANQQDGDAERVRQLVDKGHGAPPMRVRGPATEMDQALGARASYRDAVITNADTYVVALCILAFASLALLGFYPIHSAWRGEAAITPPPAIACGEDAKLPATCR